MRLFFISPPSKFILQWHSVSKGDMSQCLHCKRKKRKTSVYGMFYVKKNSYMLPLMVTLQYGIFWMGSFTKGESLLYKKKENIQWSGGIRELLHCLGYKKGSITMTVPNWTWICKLHRAPLFTEMQNYMHEKFPAADILWAFNSTISQYISMQHIILTRADVYSGKLLTYGMKKWI